MIADVIARALTQWTPEDPASCDPAWAETMRQDLEQAHLLLAYAIAHPTLPGFCSVRASRVGRPSAHGGGGPQSRLAVRETLCSPPMARSSHSTNGYTTGYTLSAICRRRTGITRTIPMKCQRNPDWLHESSPDF